MLNLKKNSTEKMARLMRPTTIKQVLRGITVPITRLASNEAASIAEDLTLKKTDSLAQPLKKRHGKLKFVVDLVKRFVVFLFLGIKPSSSWSFRLSICYKIEA